MKVVERTLGPVQTNCFVLMDQGYALVIDPGDIFSDLDSVLKDNGCKLEAVLLTHGHFDHIGGLDNLLSRYDVPVYIHTSEVNFLSDPRSNGSASFFMHFISHAKPIGIEEGTHQIGHFTIQMMHTPGHTIGSSVFLYEDYMFAGDTLFQGSIGRTDLPSGSMMQMRQSLKRLAELDTNYTVFCGHGPNTTLEQEKSWNPYLRAL